MGADRKFAGLVVPLVTPLDANGRVDTDRVKGIVDYVLSGSVDAIFVLGSTGEGPLLADGEKERMVAATIAAAGDNVPVVVGVSDTSLPRAIENTRAAKRHGAWAVCACPPFYNYCYDQDEIIGFYTGLADAAGEAVIVYNIPSKHATPVAPESVEGLAAAGVVFAIKDSSGDLSTALELIDVSRRCAGFTVLGGAANWSVSVLLGAHGVVEALANVAPRQCRRLLDAALDRDVDRTRELRRELEALWDSICTHEPIASLKAAMAAMDLCSAYVAQPGRSLGTHERASLREVLASHGVTA